MSPWGNTKLSHKAETNNIFLVTTVTSVAHLSFPTVHQHHPSSCEEHFMKSVFLSGLDAGYGTFQLQIASVIPAQVDNDINVWQMFCLHEMIYSYSSSCTGVQYQNEIQQVLHRAKQHILI